jgi:hypothetical protein|tara:strand:- start:158 stop:976 length:819 start_codon:yes stop_codon:yes gene_type:complete
MNNILEIDLSKRLEIKINNQAPVALQDLSLALLSFNRQFHKFVESETNRETDVGTELLIKEVRSGSIIVELVSQAAPIVPLLWEGGTLGQWAAVVEGTCKWLLGKAESPPREMSKQDLQEWNKFVEPVAKDNGSQMNINVSNGGKVINHFSVNSNEAKAIQNQIGRLVDDMDTPEDNIHLRKVMYWYQTKFDPESDTGNRAIIDDLSKSSLKVIFENNAVKDAMLHSDSKFGKPWHELAYLVDVEVQTVRGTPKLYKVLRYYPEDTFDPGLE